MILRARLGPPILLKGAVASKSSSGGYNTARLDSKVAVIARYRASRDARPSGRAAAMRSRGTEGARGVPDCFVASLLAMTIPPERDMLKPGMRRTGETNRAASEKDFR
jgi:hypothetical protein